MRSRIGRWLTMDFSYAFVRTSNQNLEDIDVYLFSLHFCRNLVYTSK